MHPNLSELKALYDAGSLAVVPRRRHPDRKPQPLCQPGHDGAGGLRRRTSPDRRLAGPPPQRPGRAKPLPGLGAITAGAEVDIALEGYLGAVAVPNVLALFTVLGGEGNQKIIESMNTGAGHMVVVGPARRSPPSRRSRSKVATLLLPRT